MSQSFEEIQPLEAPLNRWVNGYGRHCKKQLVARRVWWSTMGPPASAKGRRLSALRAKEKLRHKPKWMVYSGGFHFNRWFGGPPISGKIQILKLLVPAIVISARTLAEAMWKDRCCWSSRPVSDGLKSGSHWTSISVLFHGYHVHLHHWLRFSLGLQWVFNMGLPWFMQYIYIYICWIFLLCIPSISPLNMRQIHKILKTSYINHGKQSQQIYPFPIRIIDS